MAIPANITRQHVLTALARIDKEGVPANRKSRKYSMVHNGVNYPAKYVISVANEVANQNLLHPGGFNTYHAQDVLRGKGFECIPPKG